jgi:hypothetical protein
MLMMSLPSSGEHGLDELRQVLTVAEARDRVKLDLPALRRSPFGALDNNVQTEQRFGWVVELTLPQGSDSALAANGNLCAVTKTVLVKKKVSVKSKGHTKTVTRQVKQTVAGSLVMPTAFTAQNGAVIHQNTPIAVTGCGKSAKKAKDSRRGGHKVKKK